MLPKISQQGRRILKILDGLSPKSKISIEEIAAQVKKSAPYNLRQVNQMIAQGYVEHNLVNKLHRYRITELGRHYIRQSRLAGQWLSH